MGAVLVFSLATMLSFQEAATVGTDRIPPAPETPASTNQANEPPTEPATGFVRPSTTRAGGKTDERTYREDWFHIKNGHHFLPSPGLGSTFVDSHITLASGVGYLTRDITFRDRTRELQIAGFSPLATAQVRVWKRIAVGAAVSGNVVAGTDTFSAAAYGSSVAYNARASVLAGLVDTDRTAVTFALDVLKPKRLTVSPLRALAEGVRGLAGQGNPDFVDDSVATQWRPEIRAAYALNPAFGLRGVAGWGYNSVHQNETATEEHRLKAGGGVELDFRSWLMLPVALSANYVRSQAIDKGESSNVVTAGLYENIRSWSNFGLEAGISRTGGRTTYIGLLVLRSYYE
jgi:hypothetical protein